MMGYSVTIRPAAPSVLGDNSSSTYADDSASNGGPGPIVAPLAVAALLSVQRGRDAIESVAFGCVAGSESAGLLDTPRLEWTVAGSSGSEPIALAGLELSTVESAPQPLAPSGQGWTWDDVCALALQVAQDVVLDPGQSAVLRVAELYAVLRLNVVAPLPQRAYGRNIQSGSGRALAFGRW